MDSRKSALRDLIVISALGVFIAVLAIRFEVFETFMALTRQHEDWELDETISFAVIFGYCSSLFFFLTSRCELS